MNNFIRKSKNLLLKFLQEPGGFSFFPSSFFWKKKMNNSLIKEKYKLYFKSSYYKTDNNNKLNLYIHVPFCAKICFYCNCFKKLRQREIEIDLYVKFLKKEVKELYKLNNNKKIKINTIFIGGGTPNLLNINQFNNIFLLIKKYFDLSNLEQFLIDGHPNYYTEEKIRLFKKNNVSRVTLAVQTFDEKVLKLNNRDVYNKEEFEKNINFLNENNIASNIDLLIGLKGQTLNSIKNDIKFLQGISISNISIHYLMKSNNIKYDLPDNYLDLIKKTREYLENINLPKLSPNIQEDYFVSKKSSTISLGSNGVINLFGKIIYIKPGIKKYFDDINQNKLPFYKGIELSLKDEMIKYIYLNILYGINIIEFNVLFGKNVFKEFFKEFDFLNKNKILYIKNNVIYSNESDLKTLLLFNIFFGEKFSKFDLVDYNEKELDNFFLNTGELIDK